jgi:hypothetical protein
VCHLDAEMIERALEDWPPSVYHRAIAAQPSAPVSGSRSQRLSTRYNVQDVNALTRIARLLLVGALSFGTPLPSLHADEAAAFGASLCRSQLLVCAKLQQSEARAAIVSARESTQFSLKSAKRSSPWQAAVLLPVAFRSTAQDSISRQAGGRITLLATGLAARPVRAPPAIA